MRLNTLLLFFLACASANMLHAQVTDTNARWIWKNGLNGTGRYQIDGEKRGTIGQPYSMVAPPVLLGAMNNWPGSRSSFAHWTDTTGRLYQFGGAFNDQNSFNQVWRIHPDSGTWTWVHGKPGYASSGALGQLYSAVGVPHKDNMPHNRHSMMFVADDVGCVWVFGGLNNSTSVFRRNDLWKYNPYTNEWAWYGGNTTYSGNPLGNYGTKGVPAASNQPGSRGAGRGALWIDNKGGKLYLFGGLGYAKNNTQGSLTDFWSFDIATNMWTWIGGGDSITTHIIANYGTQGVAAASNFPQPREDASTWTDADGNFWMYGGLARLNIGSTAYNFYMNDMWKYDPKNGMWTWVKGDKIDLTAAKVVVQGASRGYYGVYGNRGVPDAANNPGSRWRSGTWVDADGNFWMFAGIGLAETPAYFVGQNDIWKYNPKTNEWTWMFGSKTGATIPHGTPGNYISGSGAYPGGRQRPGCWLDKNGDVWTFGGNGGGTNNEPATRSDLWKLEAIPPVIPVQPDRFTTAPNEVCAGESRVAYTIPAVPGAISYTWEYINGTNVTLNASTTAPTNLLNFAANATSGVLRVRAEGTSSPGPWRDTAITVHASPTVTATNTGAHTICDGDSLLLTASSGTVGVTYQWKHGANNVGTNSTTFHAKTAGTYTVTVTSRDNCSATSPATTLTVTPLPAVNISPATVTICTGQSATLTASGATTYSWSSGSAAAAINVSPATTTNYTVTGTTAGCSTQVTRTVTVHTAPTVTSTNTGAQAICAGDSLLLTASGSSGVTYQWKQGTNVVGTGSNYYAKAAGSYTVTATNTSNNCTTTSTPPTVLNVNSLPTSTITTSGSTDVCEGGAVRLNAASVSGATYQWMRDATAVGTNTNTYAADQTGSYKVVVRYTATGCADSSAAIDVTVHPRPRVVLTPPDTAFCDGGMVKLEVVSQDTGLTYVWKDGGGTIPLASAYFLEITETGNYTVQVGRAAVSGCDTTTNEVRVTVHALPTVDATWDGETLHATPGFASYQWYISGQGIPGATDSLFVPEFDGSYRVTAIDTNGCSATSTLQAVRVDVNDLAVLSPQIQVYPNPTTGIVYINAPVPVVVSLISIDGKTLVSGATVQQIDMSLYSDGVYMLRITDINGTPIRHEKIMKH